MRRRIDLKYKKGKEIKQADALSLLYSLNETIYLEKNDDIPVFALELLKVKLELNRNNEEDDF